MPELKHLVTHVPRDPRPYSYGVKMPIPERGFGAITDRMGEFRQKHGIADRSKGMARKSPEYLRAIVFLFPEEQMAHAWVAEFGGEFVGVVPAGRYFK